MEHDVDIFQSVRHARINRLQIVPVFVSLMFLLCCVAWCGVTMSDFDSSTLIDFCRTGWCAVVSRTVTFPDKTFPGQTIPGQDVSRTDVSRTDVSRPDDSRTKLFPDRRFPDNTFFRHHFTVAEGERVNRLIVSFKRSVAGNKNIMSGVSLRRGQSNLTKSASRGAHYPVRGHPRGSKVVPLNSWGRVSY